MSVPSSLKVALAALVAEASGLLGVSAVLFADPYPATDPETRSLAYALLFTAAGVILLTGGMLRGSRAAWLTICLITGLLLVFSSLWAGLELLRTLGDRPISGEAGSEVVVIGVSSPTFADAVVEAGAYLLLVGAAVGLVALLLPSTRGELRRRRRGGAR